MKTMRWLVGIVALLLVVFFALGPPPVRAVTTASPTSTCDEHPWDKIKNAYRVQFLVITDEYVLVAVWYTQDQIYPVILRINTTPPDRKVRSKSAFIFVD